MKGWNGDWLEIGLSKAEAVALRDLLGFLADHPAYRIRSSQGEPMTPDVEDALVMKMADVLHRTVHARTRA